MSDKDKINKLYWDTYNEYTIGRGDPIKGHELAMEAIEKEIRNQALGDAADICASIVADCDASNRQVAMAAGAIRCEDAIRALKSAR